MTAAKVLHRIFSERLPTTNAFPLALLLLAAAFSFAVILPHLLQRFESAYPFRGIEIAGTDSEGFYTSRVREVYDGHFSLGNVLSASPKDQPYLQPPLPEIAMALIGKAAGLDAPRAVVFTKIIFSFILVLLAVLFLTILSDRPWESLLAVAALLFVQPLLGAPWDLHMWLFDTAERYPFLRYSRPVSPLWHAPWMFAALSLITSWVRSRRTWKMLAAGACTAVLLYSYVFAWTAVAATMVFLFLFFLWKRDGDRIRDMLLFALLFLLLGIPYFLNLREAMQHPAYAETALRFGFVERRMPMWSSWGFLFLLLALSSRRIFPRAWPMAPALALGGLLALNEHVFTGMYIMNHHYFWYFVGPLAQAFTVLTVLAIVARFLPQSRFLKSGATLILLLLAVTFGVRQQALAYRGVRKDTGGLQAYAPVMAFLDAHARRGEVVLDASENHGLYALITTYTSAETTGANGGLYLKSDEDLRDALFLNLWIDGLLPSEAEERFFTDLRLYWSTGLHALYYRELLGDEAGIPDSELKALAMAYREYDALPLGEKLKKHAIAYILVTPDTAYTPALETILRRGKMIYDEGGFRVVQLSS